VRIVLDTNTVVSALLWRGTPHTLLQTIRQQESHQLFSSTVLLTELAEVLVRPWATKRLALLGGTARDILADYIEAVDLVSTPAVPLAITRDPDDDHVIAAAVAARAALIVTGDGDLLDVGTHSNIRIITAAEALQALDFA
jgi:putative PIN family toxin of toxin-antitoxin system